MHSLSDWWCFFSQHQLFIETQFGGSEITPKKQSLKKKNWQASIRRLDLTNVAERWHQPVVTKPTLVPTTIAVAIVSLAGLRSPGKGRYRRRSRCRQCRPRRCKSGTEVGHPAGTRGRPEIRKIFRRASGECPGKKFPPVFPPGIHQGLWILASRMRLARWPSCQRHHFKAERLQGGQPSC